MDKKRALILLERMLDEIPRLKNLPPENKECKTWDQNVIKLIKETFGYNSNEHARYNGTFLLMCAHTEKEKLQAYIDFLNQRETALKSIIQENKKPIFQNVLLFFDHLWQVTVKNAFEGIINGLKKP